MRVVAGADRGARRSHQPTLERSAMDIHVAPIWRNRLAKFFAAAVTFSAIAFVPAITMVIEPTSVTVAHRAGLASAAIPGEPRFPAAVYLNRNSVSQTPIYYASQTQVEKHAKHTSWRSQP